MVDEKDIEYGKIFHRQLDVIKEQEKLLDHKDSTIKALVSLCLSNGIISRGLACQYLGCGREELDEILDSADLQVFIGGSLMLGGKTGTGL